MERRLRILSAFVVLLVVVSAAPAQALDERERLWLVGSSAFNDRLYPLARRVLERFVVEYPSDPRTPDATLMLGRARFNAGDVEGALEAFRRAQTFNPPPGGRFEARLLEAEALLRLKRYADARTVYDHIIHTDVLSPQAPDALYGFGLAELELKHPEPAATAFKDLIQTWPDHRLVPNATFSLANALLDLKRYPEALPLLESFGTRFPDHRLVPTAQYLLGWTRMQMGDRRAAVIDLRTFVEKYPNHEQAPEARKLVTQTLTRFGDREEIKQNYEAIVTQSSPSPEALYDAANLAGRMGQTKDQETAWRKIVAEFPDHPLGRRAALDLAELTFKRKDWKESAMFARTAAESDDEALKAEGWLQVGEAELKLRRYTPAAAAFEEVVNLKDAEAAVRYRAFAGLGLVREEQKDWKAALAAYESASRTPDPTLRDWAQQRAAAMRTRAGNAAPAQPNNSGPRPRRGSGS